MPRRQSAVVSGIAGAVTLLAVAAMWLGQLACANAGEQEVMSLAGPWAFRLDAKDVGVLQRWFESDLPDRIQLPGSLQSQGFGNEVSVDTQWTGQIVDRSWFTDGKYEKYRRPGHIKIPFWLQPDKHYVGPAWYQKEVVIPDRWRGKRMTLSLERCHWETTVWVNGRRIGTGDSLSTPHRYDLTFGPAEKRITIRVDNRVGIGVGQNAHSVTDHTQSNWNGIVGRIVLRATDRVWIDDVQVDPDVAAKTARLRVRIGNKTRGGGRGTLTVQATSFNCDATHRAAEKQVPVTFGSQEVTTAEFDYPMGNDVQLWDEFHPALYRLKVALRAETREMQHTDATAATFGMRQIATRGTQFTINGRPIFLRGTLECCIFPKTGYPPTDVASWKRLIGICQAHGLNHMRFHSWCPPEAAFVAADESGFYLHVECAAWANGDSSLGDGKPIDKWIYAEGDRILEEYGNHPSFTMLCSGNEPGGGNQRKYLAELVDYWKQKDPRRLYTSGAGWPILPESQFHSTPAPRIQAWGAGLNSRINSRPPETLTDYRDFIRRYRVPVVSHEIGQWCVYPDFDEIPKYTGVLKPKNFAIFREMLESNHMGDQARKFLMASGKLQTLCYKEEIESALRTPGFGGFQLLDLHDFPGQGTALIGVLDPFWDSKPYVSPQAYRRFSGATVPLARMAKRTWTNDETFTAGVEVAHYGPADLEEATVAWKLTGTQRRVVAAGSFPSQAIPTGRLSKIGELRVPLVGLAEAQPLNLAVSLQGTSLENDWDLWVYPRRIDTTAPPDVLIVEDLDGQALARLQAGGKVLLMPRPNRVKGDVAIGFSSIFWNTAWTRNQPPHTLGILCDPQHPALAGFPTEYHSNWQWWELVSRSGAMVLDRMPPRLRPIVQPIDTWFENRRLGLIFEARVGGGKLLVCSIDLRSDLDQRPVARQMLHSLLGYMAGRRFDPAQTVTPQLVGQLFKEPPRM